MPQPLRQPPVDHDNSRRRHLVRFAHAAALIWLVGLAAASTLLLDPNDRGYSAQLTPAAIGPTRAPTPAPMTAATPDAVVPDMPQALPATEHDQEQRSYATHGG